MKNIQVIDGATNCAYSIYETSDDVFALIFPGDGQDVEFIDDLIGRLGEAKVAQILSPIWPRRIEKRNLVGLHGTLFFELDFKKKFYPNKKESDLDDGALQKGL